MLIPIGFFGAGAAAGAYELISTTILGSTTSSVTFSSIPSTYKHLQIRLTSRGNVAAYDYELYMRLNGDTATNYSFHSLYAEGSVVQSDNYSTRSYMRLGYQPDGATTASVFGTNIIDILDYSSSSKNKTVRSLSGVKGNNSHIDLSSGLWRSTSAISTILLYPWTGTSFVSGSRFSLYGIRG